MSLASFGTKMKTKIIIYCIVTFVQLFRPDQTKFWKSDPDPTIFKTPGSNQSTPGATLDSDTPKCRMPPANKLTWIWYGTNYGVQLLLTAAQHKIMEKLMAGGTLTKAQLASVLNRTFKCRVGRQWACENSFSMLNVFTFDLFSFCH